MARSLKTKSQRAGLPPGAPASISTGTESQHLSVLEYDELHIEQKQIASISECVPGKDQPGVTWIDVVGLSDTKVLEEVGQVFGLHPLILEDILDTAQRPKLDDFGDYAYIAVQTLSYDDASIKVTSDQVSIVLGRNYVISFEERPSPLFDNIRQRLHLDTSRIRKAGGDYLAYALLDAVVDNYFTVLERLGERIEFLEEDVVASPAPATLHTIHDLKREMLYLRSSVWPLREVVDLLNSGEVSLIQDRTRVYLRDVYDHTIEVIDTTEIFRDMLSGMLDIYLSSISNRLNEIMKFLTIISSLFIPLTFLVGVYGMNFKFMPELDQPVAYPALWLVMVSIFSGMLLWFRRKRWI